MGNKKYCYGCGINYEGDKCPECADTIYTEKPNSQTMIKELLTKREGRLGYLINDLTKEIDNYLKYKDEKYPSETYIHDKYKDMWPIRYPGATRGHIKVSENDIILEIKLYEDSDGIYKHEVRECFDKYIGMKFVLVLE